MIEEIDAKEYVEGDIDAEDMERMRRRRERLRRMKEEKERQLRIQKMVKLALPVAAVVLIFAVCITVAGIGKRAKAGTDRGGAQGEPAGAASVGDTFVGHVSAEDRTLEDVPAEDASVDDALADIWSVMGLIGANFGDEISMDNTGTETPEEHIPEDIPGGNIPVRSYSAHSTDTTDVPPEEVNSTNVVFINLDTGDILAQRDCKEVINPASMTKVLTVLVAAEHVKDMDDTFTMTVDITDYSYFNDCSSVGFAVGEVITVRDLFYGTILPSGADAAVALASYVAGSQEAFVEMMNEKAGQLGLSDTAHFTNCVGIYDADHHCTVYDMAMIMEAALDNPICREVLSAHTYTTSETPEHPEGISISNWFLRRIEDKDTGGEVVCGKTGYVSQSGSCAVSYGVDRSGREYVCATTGAHSPWRCIYDHVALYKKYARE